MPGNCSFCSHNDDPQSTACMDCEDNQGFLRHWEAASNASKLVEEAP